jgi:8-amino-7-oxononanoate synthase
LSISLNNQACPLEKALALELSDKKAQGLYRERAVVDSPQASHIVFNKQSMLNFSSNDYLGLANRQHAIETIKSKVNSVGFGSGASHLVSGHHQAHQQLEGELASFQNREAALTFSSGYMANLAILQSLAKKGDVIISDKLNHASLIDGSQLSNSDSVRYAHCDLASLERRLKKSARHKWVVTDSVFSMDGDIAPLDQIAGLCKKYSAHLIVDDAHGFGVLGHSGQGCCEYFNLSQGQLPVVMGTLGKALGGYGAFVSGSKVLIDYLVQTARPYIYTTAMPAIVAEANRDNLDFLSRNPQIIDRLNQNIGRFKKLIKQTSLKLLESNTAIQPIVIGNTQALIRVSQRLKDDGILVGAIRPPTVAANTDRLRITLSAAHTNDDIKKLVESLKKACVSDG